MKPQLFPLPRAEIWSSPESAYVMKLSSNKVTMLKGGAHLNDQRPGFAFCFPVSRGGGIANFRLWCGTETFKDLAEVMVRSDPEAATAAFAAAVSKLD